MTKRTVVISVIALLLLLIPSTLLWYHAQYSMAVARSFDAGAPAAPRRVLIATQGSAFKDTLVTGIIRHLSPREVYVHVIDVSQLPQVQARDWNAVVVLHTWEYSKPQRDARAFVDRAHDYPGLIVVTTSGSGQSRMPGVDAISAASVMSDVPASLATVTRRLDAMLKAAP